MACRAFDTPPHVASSLFLGLLQQNETAYDYNWRVAIGLGAVPPMLAFYSRCTMEETEPYTVKDAGQRKSISMIISEHSTLLLGTAGAWFILDVTFYGNSLFSGDVTQSMGVAETPLEEAWQNLNLNLLALPGYLLAVVFLDVVGRYNLQVLGFVVVGAIFALLGFWAGQLQDHPTLYITLYALTFLFVDFGPNTTTFVISSTVFPTTARATCAGIAAAMGKAGAVVGGLLFKPILADHGIRAVFLVCAAISVFGAAWTIAFVDDKESLTLDEGYVGENGEVDAPAGLQEFREGS